MPAYNEAGGIAGFLRDIHDHFDDLDYLVVVVDDCSGDTTSEVVQSLAQDTLPVDLITATANRGHGPATLTALHAAVDRGSPWIVATDGDGQISGSDLRQIFVAVCASESGYVEGVRTKRSDPWFRKVVSAGTRTLVWLRCGVAPRDANTPFRAYSRERLEEVLTTLPGSATTPNLTISALARKKKWAITEVPITSRPRRGTTAEGSTWNQKNPLLPSKRFVQFCVQAMSEWLRQGKRHSQ